MQTHLSNKTPLDSIDLIKALLLLKGKSQIDLARMNDLRPSNLSNWMRGVDCAIATKKEAGIAESLGLVDGKLDPSIVHEWSVPSGLSKKEDQIIQTAFQRFFRSASNDSSQQSNVHLISFFRDQRIDAGMVIVTENDQSKPVIHPEQSICINLKNCREFAVYCRMAEINFVELSPSANLNLQLNKELLLAKSPTETLFVMDDDLKRALQKADDGGFATRQLNTLLHKILIQTMPSYADTAKSLIQPHDVSSFSAIDKDMNPALQLIDGVIKELNQERERIMRLQLLAERVLAKRYKFELNTQLKKLPIFQEKQNGGN